MSGLASHYYIKARDVYPYDLQEALEAVGYALSYDDEHAGAHCLKGQMLFEQEKNFREAFYHFEQALVHDPEYIETYYCYADALIAYGEFDRAERLLDHAINVRGICQACILRQTALLKEYKGKYGKAIKLLNKAIKRSVHNGEIADLKDELKRVKEKLGVK